MLSPPTPQTTPGRGKKPSGQERRKKEAKRNGGCVTEILLAIEVILFLFVWELFIINFFSCLICEDVFLVSFFFWLYLPCFLLILGDWACLVICFVVYCYLFIFLFLFFLFFIYLFFTFMDFLFFFYFLIFFKSFF